MDLLPHIRGTMLTAERLCEVLKYDPETGNLSWLVRGGKIAGCLQVSNGQRRITIRIDNKYYKAHRLAWLYMTGKWPVDDIDHINGDGADNRWCNLRAATRSENLSNRVVRKNSKSGLKGVERNNGNTWCARICSNGNRIYLGNFPTKEEAHMAYVRAAERLFGEFACNGRRD